MCDHLLTSDNLHLSEIKTVSCVAESAEQFAVNCTPNVFLLDKAECLSDAANDLLRHSLADIVDVVCAAFLLGHYWHPTRTR